jgi:hypothetical protein
LSAFRRKCSQTVGSSPEYLLVGGTKQHLVECHRLIAGKPYRREHGFFIDVCEQQSGMRCDGVEKGKVLRRDRARALQIYYGLVGRDEGYFCVVVNDNQCAPFAF